MTNGGSSSGGSAFATSSPPPGMPWSSRIRRHGLHCDTRRQGRARPARTGLPPPRLFPALADRVRAHAPTGGAHPQGAGTRMTDIRVVGELDVNLAWDGRHL